MIWNMRKQKNNQLEQQEEKRILENPKNPQCKQPLGQIQAFQHSHYRVLEGEEKEQEIENLSENLIKENFPNLVKEIDMEFQKARSPKQDGCKEAHSKTYHN